MPRRSKGPKAPKVKQPKIDLIDPTAKPAHEPYRLMTAIRREHHPDTSDARIALAWMIGTKADVDGHIALGKCVKASDLQRELVDWDFVILLNKEVWESKEFVVEKKKALLDHELCHAEIALDKDGEPKTDAKGRKVWRIRKHDIEEFTAIIRRHGCYKSDLERFAEVILKQQSTLFAEPSSETTPALVQ